ncbi:MAG: hypothetical protein ACX94A_09795 [Algiphilus sp.]
MKKVVAIVAACAWAVPTLGQAGFFGEDRSVKYTVAADYVGNDVSFSDTEFQGLSNKDLDTDMVNLRLGVRPENFAGRGSFVTFEAQVGMGISDDESAEDIETDIFYGLFVVPHAVVFELFELSFPVGYARTELTKDGATESFDSVSFGGNIMLPLRLFMPDAPDIRISGGGQVYHQSSELRVFGYNVGLRWDF